MESPAHVRALEMLQQDLPLRLINAVTRVGRRILRRWRAGDFEPRIAGRPPIGSDVRRLVLERDAAGESSRQIGRQLGISHQSVRNLVNPRKAKKPTPRKLRRGEQLLATPMRCDQGHLVNVWPCRQCKTMATIERFRGLQRRARKSER